MLICTGLLFVLVVAGLAYYQRFVAAKKVQKEEGIEEDDSADEKYPLPSGERPSSLQGGRQVGTVGLPLITPGEYEYQSTVYTRH